MKHFSTLHQLAVYTFIILSGLNCASASRNAAVTSKNLYPGTLVDTRTIAPDFFWQQRVTAYYGDKTVTFPAVVQLHQGKLTLVILSPTGHRAYTLIQERREISFIQSIDRPLPFSPKNILIDLHRIFFLGIKPRPSSDGIHSARQGGELIVEVYNNKKLKERRYRRLDARPKGWIRILYIGGMADHKPPSRIDLINGWYGYRLTIKTLKQE